MDSVCEWLKINVYAEIIKDWHHDFMEFIRDTREPYSMIMQEQIIIKLD